MDAEEGIENPPPEEIQSSSGLGTCTHSHTSNLEDMALPDVAPLGDGEAAGDMPIVHVHPPHSIQSWKDFFVNIAVVATGLLIALGLEQSVEYVHHRSERIALEREMRETFASDITILPEREKKLARFRAYLIDIRKAVAARLENRSYSNAPEETDPRNDTLVPPPNLGPYNAAKANGTIALLDLGRIRIYERIDFQHSLMLDNFRQFYMNVNELRAFRQRFDLPPVKQPSGVASVDLASLSVPQLSEYQMLLGNVIQGDILYAIQLQRLERAYRAVLNGAHDDNEVMEAALKEGAQGD